MKTKKSKIEQATVETYLPIFPGFYGTLYGAEDSDDEEQAINGLLEPAGFAPSQINPLSKAVFDFGSGAVEFDYSTYYRDYLEEISETVAAELEGVPGFVSMELQGMRSPKEYNFANDSGDVILNLSNERAFRAWILKQCRIDRAGFAEYIRKKYTSRSGFMSFYSSDSKDWINDIRAGLDELDGHKLGRLLDYYFSEISEFDDWALYETAEKPYLSEYMSGPVVDIFEKEMGNLPEKVSGILESINAGREQLKAYAEKMPCNAAARQETGLIKNETKLYKAAVETLIEA